MITFENLITKTINQMNDNNTGKLGYFEYDSSQGGIVFIKYSEVSEIWNEYDSNGNITHFRNSDGYEEWMEYDDHGRMINYKDSDGNKETKLYDDNGNMIYNFLYNSNLNAITSKEWEYNSQGKMIHSKNVEDGYEEWKEYDETGNMIRYMCSDGKDEIYEYNERGNLIHTENLKNGYEEFREYDENGNLIHCKKFKKVKEKIPVPLELLNFTQLVK